METFVKGARIRDDNMPEHITELYDKFPQFRGKTPNKLFNIAWKEFLKNKGVIKGEDLWNKQLGLYHDVPNVVGVNIA